MDMRGKKGNGLTGFDHRVFLCCHKMFCLGNNYENVRDVEK